MSILYDQHGRPITPGAYTGLGPTVRFPWLIIYQAEPRPMFYATHGRNFSKFEQKQKEEPKRFQITGRVPDFKMAQRICREMNDKIPGMKQDRLAYRAKAGFSAAVAEARQRIAQELKDTSYDS